MAVVDILLGILIFLWDRLKDWLYIYITPFLHIELLWIIIPVWLNWFFAEWFQEKHKTSFGNAITNGIVPVYVGLDWARRLTGQLMTGNTVFSFDIFQKYLLTVIAISYGIFIIYSGIKGKSFVPYIGRIREITYVLVMFHPIIYGFIDLNLNTLFAILIYFPIYYFTIELIDHYVPDPKIYELDEGNGSSSSFGSTSGSKSSEEFKF